MTTSALIEEIVTKECERYELEKSGFVSDRGAVVSELVSGSYASLPESCSPEEFAEWKQSLLDDWYSRKSFARFFRRKAEKRCMFRLVKRLLQNRLSRLRRRQTAKTLDDELKVEEGRTVAFKLSSALFVELYQKVCCGNALFVSPGQLEDCCVGELHSLFPLDYASLYKRLCVKDNEFWEEIWRLVHRFVRFLVTEKRGREDEETVKDVSMETVLSVQEQLERGKLEQITSARHLLNSLQTTARNKLYEWFRAADKRKEEICLDEEDWMQLGLKEVNSTEAEAGVMHGHFDYLLEVDENNEYEVCCALADVLNYGQGRVYEELVEDRQELAQIISMLYVENRQYEEIARVIYGDRVDARKLASIRKTVSRGKEHLKKRMVSLILVYKRKGVLPFDTEIEEE